jgi:Rrf2 family protein
MQSFFLRDIVICFILKIKEYLIRKLSGNMFSNACIYGIQAAIYIAMQQEEQFIPTSAIAHELSIPFQFLKKILQKLAEQNILGSQRSAKGGVKLARPSDMITLFDIIAAIDGVELLTNRCILNMPGCGNTTPCPLHALWGVERARLRRLFENATLRDMAERTIDLDLRLGMLTPEQAALSTETVVRD